MLTQIMIPVVHVETVVDIKPKFLIALERKDKSVFRTKSHLVITCYFSVTRHKAVTLSANGCSESLPVRC